MEKEQLTLLKKFKEKFGSSKEITLAFELIDQCYSNPIEKKKAIIHCSKVAQAVSDLDLEKTAIIAAFLCLPPEKEEINEKIEEKFGKTIGKTLIELLDLKKRFAKSLSVNPEDNEKSRKKILVLLSTNPTIVIIQLCEMLVNLRTLNQLPKNEKTELVFEIKEVFSPLAHKIGLYFVSAEMNDLVFKYEEPEKFAKIENAIKKKIATMKKDVEETQKTIETELKKAKIDAEVSGRIKSIYSTYEKMKRKKLPIEKIHDLIALRIVTDSTKNCYETLGLVHSTWIPQISEFDDYIAKPKENGYKSLHTTVLSPNKNFIEIQIRDKEMHNFSEYGIEGAHWAYKGEKKDNAYEKKTSWTKQLLDWQKTSGKNATADLFGKEIFALTPKGEVISLPENATIIDFAYAVHSEVGNKCKSAKINGVLAPLNSKINNGDVVEIITSQKQLPKMNWLNFVKTQKAKQKIRTKLHIQKIQNKTNKLKKGSSQAIKTNNSKVKLAKCCSPIPGDEIVGFKTTKRKISVHRIDCEEILKIIGEKVDVEWQNKGNSYEIEIIVKAKDRLGLLKDLLTVLSSEKINIDSTNARISSSGNVDCKFVLNIKNSTQLEKVIQKLLKVKGVSKVTR